MKCCEVCNAVWIIDAPAFPVASCSFTVDDKAQPQSEMVPQVPDINDCMLPVCHRRLSIPQRGYCRRIYESEQYERRYTVGKNGTTLHFAY